MCDCIEQLNQKLNERGLRIAQRLMMGKVMTLSPAIIEVEPIDTKSRVRSLPVLATYCPFCGERYEPLTPEKDGK